MKTLITPEVLQVKEELNHEPKVSIIIPFDPKMKPGNDIARYLEITVDKVEQQLINYPDEGNRLIMNKLRRIIKDLNFNTHKDSIAIYLSPAFEKILYLNFDVNLKITVGASFAIRDLVYDKKELQQYLVLMIGTKESRIYFGESTHLKMIVANTHESVYFSVKELREKMANFVDKSKRKEIIITKFIKRIDNTLDIILHAYRLPLFVLSSQRIIDHFKDLSTHAGIILEYKTGNFDDLDLGSLQEILDPLICDWKTVRQTDLLNQIELASEQNKIVIGIKDVWQEAVTGGGKLLVVEKNFMQGDLQNSIDDLIGKAVFPDYNIRYVGNQLDVVMEKVLENGGDIEFVEDGVLKDYKHIALIRQWA